MAYPAAHSIITFSGPAYGDLEQWATGVRLRRTTPPTVEQVEAAGEAFIAFMNNAELQGSSAAKMQSAKWAPQTVEGKYGDGQAVEHLFSNRTIGQNASMPAQIAVVISLRTARPRGRASNGRMYVPALPSLVANTGKFSAADATDIAVAGSTMIGAIGEALDTECVVASAVGTGLLETITGVRVGRVPDTQRRRREGLVEEYSAEAPVDFN
uniref:Uncharacterized protein n=1 Tax=uncultured prokaryote TaxID=198431 RepID=A0A0H5Q317_9ZZZZ|nr:hypothetical protein [uncultured prokaryote]